jgi:hypothetical protein
MLMPIKVSSRFRHNHAHRIVPKPARAKVRAFRNNEFTQWPDKDQYLRPYPRAHVAIAEELMHAAELVDLEAIAHDGVLAHEDGRDWLEELEELELLRLEELEAEEDEAQRHFITYAELMQAPTGDTTPDPAEEFVWGFSIA